MSYFIAHFQKKGFKRRVLTQILLKPVRSCGMADAPPLSCDWQLILRGSWGGTTATLLLFSRIDAQTNQFTPTWTETGAQSKRILWTLSWDRDSGLGPFQDRDQDPNPPFRRKQNSRIRLVIWSKNAENNVSAGSKENKVHEEIHDFQQKWTILTMKSPDFFLLSGVEVCPESFYQVDYFYNKNVLYNV